MSLEGFCKVKNISTDELKIMSIINLLITSRGFATNETIDYLVNIKIPNLNKSWIELIYDLIEKRYIHIELRENEVIYMANDKSQDILGCCNKNKVLSSFFYDSFYKMADESNAHGEFCSRVYGKNLRQHGMADMNQIDDLINMARITGESKVLEIGCGSGYVAEYINDITGADITGIDLSEEAINLAAMRMKERNKSVRFMCMNMENLDFDESTFDYIIAVDSLFFTRDVEGVVDNLLKILKPCGKILTFMIYPNEEKISNFEQYLKNNNLKYKSKDFTKENFEHWKFKKDVLLDLREKFQEEGNLFLYHNRMAECSGGVDLGSFIRLLYVIEL